MPDDHSTRYENRGAAAWITLSSPKTRNALSVAMVAELIAHLRRAMADDAVRAVVLTGDGSAFCAGADLKRGGDMGAGEQEPGNPFVTVLKLMRDGPKPVLCAVNGHAFGGGLGLVAAADIVVAVQGAKFSFSEVRIGVIPGMVSVVVLPKVGPHNTMRLFLTGERFDAAQAVRYGLVHRAVAADALISSVEEEIEMIARGGPVAVGEAKRLVRTVARLGEDEAFAYAEEKIAKLFASEEAAEGMAAFAEKRPPGWVTED